MIHESSKNVFNLCVCVCVCVCVCGGGGGGGLATVNMKYYILYVFRHYTLFK